MISQVLKDHSACCAAQADEAVARGQGEYAVLSRAQWRAAWALAHEHAHEWAYNPDVAPFILRATDDGEGALMPHTVAQLMEQYSTNMVPGIRSPQVCGEGENVVVIHETGTGRLRWTVHPDGSVAAEVHRPHVGSVLVAFFGADGGACHVQQTGPAELRHFAALGKVTHALHLLWQGHYDINYGTPIGL